jgi:RNA polymerase sigma-70 factor (ECF subfamily)
MTTDFSARDEDDLVREIAAGSHEALAELYDRHVGPIFAMARRLAGDRQMAEEVVQDTFLILWNRAELYDPASGSVGVWLRSIARNRAIDRHRAAARRPHLVPASRWSDNGEADDATLDRMTDTRPVVGGSAPPLDPEDAAVSAWTVSRIQDALDEMPDDERVVIVMAYDEDLTQSEIATQLGWPIGTVKSRTRRALRRLQSVLGPDLAEDRPAEASVAAGGGTDGAR